MEKTRKMLEEEIEEKLKFISSSDPDSKEHSMAVQDLSVLYKLKIEEDKNVFDWAENLREHGERSKEQKIRLLLDGVSIVLPMMFYGVWMRKGFKFEETGSFTSTTFRGLFNRFKPTK
ncbi:hypothetical protein [Anaerostipes sp. PC18]|uniref:hypothetical protein n=1 Tax=Anaerostipes sp. PC18 TaxID=3036926 RepID=UPI00308E54A3|nr:hypothetical protein P8F77_10415 [Anaerostipes sp. PC18]